MGVGVERSRQRLVIGCRVVRDERMACVLGGVEMQMRCVEGASRAVVGSKGLWLGGGDLEIRRLGFLD